MALVSSELNSIKFKIQPHFERVAKWLIQSGQAKGVKLRDSSHINEEWSAQTGTVQACETSL